MRIGAGYLLQETNTFSPVRTRLADFNFCSGAAAVERWQGTRTELGGFLEALSTAGCETVPLFAGWAVTAGSIGAAEFRRMKEMAEEQIRRALPLDGLLLALHGAMCAEGTDDCEGALLEIARGLVGPDCPVVATLDLHANLTARMAAAANALIGYRTYPHVDMFETGLAAGAMLLRAARGEIRPVTAIRKVPMILPAENMQTTHGPMAALRRETDALCRADAAVLAASIFGVQPWLDIEEMGCGIAIVTHGDPARGAAAARKLAERFWDLRDEFAVDLLPPDEAIRRALAVSGRPVILAESSDSPTAGSPGDSADLLASLLQLAPRTDAAVWLRDPAAVQQACLGGPGSVFDMPVGGAFDRANRRPVRLRGVVRSLSDGSFRLKGQWNTGATVSMGPTAVIDAGPVAVVISEGAAGMIDPELYRSQGVEPREKKIVVVKSATAFRADYGPFAAAILLVDTPGISSANLRSVPYTRVPRPMYPLDTMPTRREFLLAAPGAFRAGAALRITNPPGGAILNRHDGRAVPGGLEIEVAGECPEAGAVQVNGAAAQAQGGKFRARVTLRRRENRIEARQGSRRHAIAVLWDRGSYPRYRLSTDDNIWFLRDIARNGYRSIFDNPYLQFWREMHRKYGTKVHFNIYYETEGFDLTRMPDRYRGEWRGNSDWIRLTFHARANDPDRPYIQAGAEQIREDYRMVTREIERFAGKELLSPVTTVHWGETTREGALALRREGIRIMPGYFQFRNGKPAVSYYLDAARTQYLSGRDYWKDMDADIIFIRHDIVLNTVPLEKIVPHLERIAADPHQSEIMELMIHEQYFYPHYRAYEPDFRQRVERALEWVTKRGYRPVFYSQGFLGAEEKRK